MISDKELYEDALEILRKKFGDNDDIEITERKDMDFDEGVYTIQIYKDNGDPQTFREEVRKVLENRDYANNQFQVAIDARGGGHYVHIGNNVTRRIR